MKDMCTFKSRYLNEVHKINKKYNCNSKMAVYLIGCEICGEQYTDILAVQKQSLDLGQTTIRVHRESL